MHLHSFVAVLAMAVAAVATYGTPPSYVSPGNNTYQPPTSQQYNQTNNQQYNQTNNQQYNQTNNQQNNQTGNQQTNNTQTTSPANYSSKPSKVVAGYYPDYRSKVFPADQVDYAQYTHIFYFVATQTDANASFAVSDEANMQSLIRRAHAFNVNVSISFGGWTGSRFFSDQVSTDDSRKAFAQTLVDYANKYGFDGIDVDWEYPNDPGIGCNTYRPEDYNNFVSLFGELRTLLGQDKILSAPISINGYKGSDGNPVKDLSKLAALLNFTIPMVYDVYGPDYFSPIYISGPNSPLYPMCLPSLMKAAGSTAVDALMKAGFRPEQILYGIATYGYAYTTISNTLKATTGNETYTAKRAAQQTTWTIQEVTKDSPPGGPLAGPAGNDICGKPTAAGATWTYNELVQAQKLADENGLTGATGYVRKRDDCTVTAILFNDQTKNFISYDDPETFQLKGKFAKLVNLGGVSVFDMAGDTKSSVLLKAVRSRLLDDTSSQ